MAGRPSKLTAEAEAAILDALEDGATWAGAAAAAGLHPATVHRWRERGAGAKQGRFREFCDAAARASARGEAKAARQLVAGFTEPTIETTVTEGPEGVTTKTVTRPPDARLALEWLARRRPEQWGANTRVTVRHGTVREALAALDIDALPPAELAALERILDTLEGSGYGRS